MQYLIYVGIAWSAISAGSMALFLIALAVDLRGQKRTKEQERQRQRRRDEAMYQAYLRELKAEAFIADLFAEPHEPKHPSDSNPYDISRIN